MFANTDWYLYSFRFELAKALSQTGFTVTLLSPKGEYASKLNGDHIKWNALPISRKGTNLITEFSSLLNLVSFYRKNQFDLVHHFTIKCVLYGSLAAKLSRTENVVNSITGLGHVFLSKSLGASFRKMLVLGLYRIALKGTTVIFQNKDDQQLFLHNGIITDKQAVLIPGSGVNTITFSYKPEPEQDPPVVLLPGRLLKEKGVYEFIQAARIINRTGKHARFILVGEPDDGNPSTISYKTILEWKSEGIVDWWRWEKDMPGAYHSANLVCLPSYREGLSKTLVEASACGRAIVTTDIPGCRDVVEHGTNGLLVPVGDPKAIAKAINALLRNPGIRRKMGLEGRQRVKQYFSSEIINAKTLKVYNTRLGSNG